MNTINLTFKRAQEAEDAVLDKIGYPIWVQPKIDGVRAWNPHGTLVGRSMDPFEGYGITEFFSQDIFKHFDGEMILGTNPACTDGLCRATTGAMGRFKGVTEMANLHWNVFDYLCPTTIRMTYSDRYLHLKDVVAELQHPRIHLVPFKVAFNRTELNAIIAEYFEAGYEGAIIRNPRAKFKEGRATQKNQELWRVKPWSDAEILVTGITEGEDNYNEKTTNSLGRSERSSAKAGKVLNGTLGSIQGTMLADFYCPWTKKKLFSKDQAVTVGPGEMNHKDRKYYFENQSEIVDHYVKFKHMTHGIKDQPRFPTYLSHRLKQDIGPV